MSIGLSVCGQPAPNVDQILAAENQLRDSMRQLLKDGVDLSTGQARQRYLYEPALKGLPEAIKGGFERYLSMNDALLGAAMSEGKYDIADRYFNGLADSVRIENTVGNAVNVDLNDQAEIARKTMCALYPAACTPPNALRSLDPDSIDLNYVIKGAWSRFPPQFRPYVSVVNNRDTLRGLHFVEPCRPPPSEKCSSVDGILRDLFGK